MATFTSGSRRGWGGASSALLDDFELIDPMPLECSYFGTLPQLAFALRLCRIVKS